MSDTAAVLEPPATPAKKPRRKGINYALAGALAATTSQTWNEIASQVGSASGTSLKSNLCRKGVNKKLLRTEPAPGVVMTLTHRVATEAADLIRERLNGELLEQTAALGTKRATFKSLNSKGQGRAATVKQIAETWRTLNGNPDQITVQFGANMLSDFTPTPQPVVSSAPVVDVESSITTPPVQVPEQT